MTSQKMLYSDYKKYWSHCKTCGDYDPVYKTITVMIPTDEWKEHLAKSHNKDNRYSFVWWDFLVQEPGFKEPFTLTLKAKDIENARKQLKKYLKENNAVLIKEIG